MQYLQWRLNGSIERIEWSDWKGGSVLGKDIYFFVKFGKKEYLESLYRGIVRFNTLGFYKNYEEDNEKKKGIGDKTEGCLLINNISIKLISHVTNELIFEGPADSAVFQSPEYLTKPVMCLSFIDNDNLWIKEKKEDSINAKIKFSNEQKEMYREFGDSALVIHPVNFLEKINNILSRQGLSHIKGAVEYSDFSINQLQRIQHYIDGDAKAVFWKDKFFEPQKEYRIFILNRDISEPFEINIGSMSNYACLIPAEDLLNERFGLLMSLR